MMRRQALPTRPSALPKAASRCWARETQVKFGATVEKFMDDHPEWYLSTMKELFPGRKATG
jgi:hypothetical protein